MEGGHNECFLRTRERVGEREGERGKNPFNKGEKKIPGVLLFWAHSAHTSVALPG